MATTTTVVHTYFYPGRVREEVEPDILPTPTVIPEAPLRQPLDPWDFPPEPLPDIEMEPEPMSPELPAAKHQPQPMNPVIELSSTATSRTAAASLPYPEYHLGCNPNI